MELDHIAILVSDVNKVKELLGKIGKFDLHYEVVEEQEVEVLFVSGNPRLEFISPISKSSPIYKYLVKKGEFAFHHIAIKSKDILSDMERLKKEGFIFTSDKAMNGADNTKVAFIHPKSTGGVLIELISYERQR
jgi:methylmalonyl-CoA/ethylmalonyl-CoA epimerase